MAKLKEIIETTDNSRIYKIALKMYREKQWKINCSFCPYHRYDNLRWNMYRRNWKQYRKNQYK